MKIKKYENFINENMSLAKSIMTKKVEAFEKLKKLLVKNIGYIGKFTDYLMYGNIAFEDLKNLYDDLLILKSKNVNIDINTLDYEELVDQIQTSKETISINSLVNEFPALQKDLAKKELKRNSSFQNVMLKVSKKDNIEAFISKISRYKNIQDLKNTLEIFSKDPLNSREVIKELVSKMDKSSIVKETEKSIIVHTYNLEDAKQLASDTSWCIIHSGMWDSYTRGNYQFILFDFTKDEFNPNFKIGFTLKPDGSIRTSHNILDNYISDTNMIDILKNNDATTLGLISEIVGKIPGLDIDSITAKTTQTKITSLINTTFEQLELEKLLVKIFDIYKVSEDIEDRHLTDNKRDLVKTIIRKTFSYKPFLIIDDLNAVDKRIINFYNAVNGISDIRDKYIDKKNYSDCTFDIKLFGTALDHWTDDVIIKALQYKGRFNHSRFVNTNKDLGEVKQYQMPKEAIIKFSDRINKIYKNYIFSKPEYKISFGLVVLFINAILGRSEKSEGIDIPKSYNIEYPGLFSSIVDLTGEKLVLGSSYNNFPISRIEKKNYGDDTEFQFMRSAEMSVYELMDHLNGYNFTIYLSKKLIENIRDSRVPETGNKKILLDCLKDFKTKNKGGYIINDSDIAKDVIYKSGKMTIKIANY